MKSSTSTVVPKEEPDMYQQEHPIESEDLILAKLDELEVELDKIDEDDRVAYVMALDKCPELVTKKEKLQFLRCEVFNADLAAQRIVSYWTKRLEIFGPERAFLPLTLTSGAFTEGDMVAMNIGFIRLLPQKADPGNRNILFANPALQDKSKYSTLEMARAFWYIAHVALEDEDSQRKGLIFMAYPYHAQIGQMNKELVKTIIGNIRGCLPIRLSAIHICHPPAVFQIIFPFVKLVMGSRLRKRILVNGGTEKHVLHRLQNKFGLPADKLPTELGGTVVLDHSLFLKNQKEARK